MEMAEAPFAAREPQARPFRPTRAQRTTREARASRRVAVPRPVGDAFRFELGVARPLRRRLRDLAPNLHVARHRVPRHARATEVDERARVDRRTLPRDEHDLDSVLAELARHTVRRRPQHAGKLIEHVLDLPRAHVLATAAHRFLLPPRVVEETFNILRREVARVEPAVAEGTLGLIRM